MDESLAVTAKHLIPGESLEQKKEEGRIVTSA